MSDLDWINSGGGVGGDVADVVGAGTAAVKADILNAGEEGWSGLRLDEAELKIGARPLTAVGPENFEAPFKDWLYRVNLTAGESSTETGSTRAVEVIVWHTQENIVHRVTQLFRASELTRAEGEAQ